MQIYKSNANLQIANNFLQLSAIRIIRIKFAYWHRNFPKIILTQLAKTSCEQSHYLTTKSGGSIKSNRRTYNPSLLFLVVSSQ